MVNKNFPPKSLKDFGQNLGYFQTFLGKFAQNLQEFWAKKNPGYKL